MKYCHTVVFFLVFYALVFAQEKPMWVLHRPSEPGYYIGIGSARETGTPQEYMQRARNDALNDIAQQITVTISGEQMSKFSEKLGGLSSEYQAEVRASTSAELEGVETVETWDGGDEYWVYLRLSISQYKKEQAEKLRKAVSLAADLYSKAKTAEANGNFSEALQFYLQSLGSLEKYLADPIMVKYNGTEILLSNDLISSLQSLLDKIELAAHPSNVKAQVGGQVKQPLEVLATNASSRRPIPLLPVRYSFVRGSGELIATARTNQSGTALSRITKLTGTDQLQIIKAEVDVNGFGGESKADPLLETILKSFALPSARFILNVSNLTVCFQVQEMQFGAPMTLSHIETALKGAMSSQGFSFVDDPSKANLLIAIKADSRRGGDYEGFYTAYVDAQVSVVDLSTGTEIYKTSYNNAKGISQNYQDASARAYDSAAKKIGDEVLPAVLARIVK